MQWPGKSSLRLQLNFSRCAGEGQRDEQGIQAFQAPPKCSMVARLAVRRAVFRTEEEKADPGLFWLRPDEEFFAAGACHVLAGTFLAMYPRAEFSAWRIRPRAPHGRGGHIVVVRENLVFDCAGYSRRDAFLAEYVEAMRTIFPDWMCDFDKLDMDPIGWAFCGTQNHRHPSQFPHDPISRAKTFVRRFPSPDDVPGHGVLPIAGGPQQCGK